jgi:ribonuclease HI
MKIWIDGSGWNGKESKYSIAFEDGNTYVEKFGKEHTNNEMEYEALLSLLRGTSIIKGDEIFSDSQLVVNQVNGKWKVKEPRLFPLCQEAKELLALRGCILKWIPREENKAGHLMEKKR